MSTISRYIHDDLIFLNTDFNSYEQLFSEISKELLAKNFVTDNFYNKLLQREQEFPTGIDLETNSLAIPHTDPETILKEFIAIINNKQKIKFHKMDDADDFIDTDVILILGIGSRNGQLEVLKNIFAFVQDESNIVKIQNAISKNDIKILFNIN